MNIMGIILSNPLLIVNKYVFCKLTNRKFVWQATYFMDLIMTGCYLYGFGWHILWLKEKNSGLGLDPNPS